MSFILEKEGFFRKMILALFVLAMLGPWSFDLLHVPAQYPCDGVTVRLAGDFCGFPVPGFGGVIMGFSGLFRNLGALIKGNAAFLLPELTVLLIMGLVFLPSISTVLLIWKERSRGFKIVNLIFWALGGLAALLMFAMQAGRPQVAPVLYLVWGAWFYILVAVGAVTLEGMGLRGIIAKR
jgi:hypothetical protein